MRPQRRGRAIAMSDGELDDFLRAQRTARLATVGRTGQPHVMPLWFVWDGAGVWFSSLVRSRRWAHLQERPDVAVVVDAGEEYGELRGVELRGRVEVVGDVPRGAEQDDRLTPVESAFAAKYRDGAPYESDGRHAWLLLRPGKIVSWDFRKLPRGG